MKRILFVGISDKPGKLPLDESTVTGKMVTAISDLVPDTEVHRANLVDRPPIGPDGRLRYPTETEIEECLPRLRKMISVISPHAVVSLGAVAARHLKGMENHISIPHPSYMAVYRRKDSEKYIRSSAEMIISRIYRNS